MHGITGMLMLSFVKRYPDLARMILLGATKSDVFLYIVSNLISCTLVPSLIGAAGGAFFDLFLSRVSVSLTRSGYLLLPV
jgi:hypothetical protein